MGLGALLLIVGLWFAGFGFVLDWAEALCWGCALWACGCGCGRWWLLAISRWLVGRLF